MSEILNQALDLCCSLLYKNLDRFTACFRHSCSENNFYPSVDNVDWTTGFCTGTYWLAYEHTGNPDFREAALTQVDSFLDRIEKKTDVDHHDLGFLYSLSCVAGYKLTGSEKGKEAAVQAADQLLTRFQEKGQFLQAWGEMGKPENYRLIIDCLLNLPLLYWAADVTGNNRYRDVALAHTKTSVANLVRADYSTYHTYFFDPENGNPVKGCTYQGYRDGSAWARGQAWGIYGMALSYRYTGNPQCIDLFHNVTEYYLGRLPEDLIPYWDLEFMEGEEPRDSSAAAIAACGMLEMAHFLSEEESRRYRDIATKTACSLAENYAVKETGQSDGLLLHGVYAKSSPYNPISESEERGVDECVIWGDYFYMELLTRLSKQWNSYW
ncbi:glycoside hydrolase family 88 protein [Hungatella hathewayi]|uniref:glycoside hydrolase family 88 protein n=1 Tax=Hungatella hathewayi TaxID=154046 RepID=UPI0035671501